MFQIFKRMCCKHSTTLAWFSSTFTSTRETQGIVLACSVGLVVYLWLIYYCQTVGLQLIRGTFPHVVEAQLSLLSPVCAHTVSLKPLMGK